MLKLRYVGSVATNTGYSRAVHDNLMSLLTTGVNLDIEDLPDGEQNYLPRRYAKLLDVYQKQVNDWPTHIIIHTTPRPAWRYLDKNTVPSGTKKLCFTAWETNKLPRQDVDALTRGFDRIIVPSIFCEEVFISSGMPREKIRVIPHAFDPKWWWNPKPFIPPTAPYVFLNVGVWNIRKNVLGLLSAYWTEFQNREDVLLRLVCGVTPNMIADIEILQKVLNLPAYAPVEYIHGDAEWCSEETYRQVHYRSHCYITLTRGEGWGLGSFEAMLAGRPIIATDWSGHVDYLRTFLHYWPIKYQMTPCIQARLGIDGTQSWAEPDLAQAKTFMRKMYNERIMPKYFPEWHKGWADRYSYETVGQAFMKVLEEV